MWIWSFWHIFHIISFSIWPKPSESRNPNIIKRGSHIQTDRNTKSRHPNATSRTSSTCNTKSRVKTSPLLFIMEISGKIHARQVWQLAWWINRSGNSGHQQSDWLNGFKRQIYQWFKMYTLQSDGHMHANLLFTYIYLLILKENQRMLFTKFHINTQRLKR